MLNVFMDLIAKIVFSGINGVVMVPVLVLVIYLLVGQAKETIELFKEV